MLKPRKHTANCSEELNFSASFIRGWVSANMMIAEARPPSAEQIREMDRALPASPLCTMGYPSRTVAALEGVPGILNRIAVILPPVMAAQYTALRKAMATTGGIE